MDCKYSQTSSFAGSTTHRIDFTSIVLDMLNKTQHVARQCFVYLCSIAAVWCETWAFPILRYNGICCQLPYIVSENVNTTSVISLQSVEVIQCHGRLRFLIKGTRKIILRKSYNNPH